MANDSISNKLWSACNKMRQDPGTTGALQYVEQFSWLLFLKEMICQPFFAKLWEILR